MRLCDVARGEPWMTEEERRLTRAWVAAVRRLFSARGVLESPLLSLRVADVAVHCLLARRLEEKLTPSLEEGEDEGLSGALADQIGKVRERLRKALRELEDACARSGTPVDVGIADEMRSIVEKTRDLLHTGEAV